MTASEITFTEFLRNPKAVTEKVDAEDVVLRRRNEPNLRLTRDDRTTQTGEGLALAARLLRDAIATPTGRALLATSVATEVPWTRFLPEHARTEFLDEFVAVAEAAAEVGTLTPLAQLIREWRATAAIYADPELLAGLTAPMSDHGPVPEPPDA